MVREHLEEFAFLSLIRHRSLFAPDFSCRQLARLDQRLAAHWDGLAEGWPMSLSVAREKIVAPADHWETYGALRVWFELGDATPGALAEGLAGLEAEALWPWREALCRCPQPIVRVLLPDHLLDHPDPSVQSTALFALGWHGLLPAAGADQWRRHADPLVRTCLARVAAWCGWPVETTTPLLADLDADEDRLVARAARWSAALLDPVAVADRCRQELAAEGADPFTITILGLIGTPADIDLLLASAARPGLADPALQALGDLGSPRAVTPLLAWLEDPEHGARTAAALEAILGAQAGPILEAGEAALRQEMWQQLHPRFADAARFYHGLSWQGQEDPQGDPPVLHWRRSLYEAGQPAGGVKKEIPDPWFTLAADGAPTPGR